MTHEREAERALKLADQWFDEFEAGSPRARRSPWYWLSLPVAAVGFVGLLWNAPVPQAFADSTPVLNWGALFLMATIVYYFIVSVPLALGILPFVVLTVALLSWLSQFHLPLAAICGALFVAAWLGRCASAWIGGGRPACGRELQLLMIGPIWMLGRLYRRLGIPY